MILFERYKIIVGLSDLTDDIINLLSRIVFNEYSKSGNINFDNAIVELSDLKDKFSSYTDEVRNFCENLVSLKVQICDKEYYAKFVDNNVKGIYVPEYKLISLNQHIISLNNDNLKIYDIRYKLRSLFNITLTHELQHAYNDFKGEKVKSSDEDLIKYYNSDEEISAFISGNISGVKFYNIDFDDEFELLYTIRPFKDILREFKNKTSFYNALTDKNKKRFLKEVGRFYENEKENGYILDRIKKDISRNIYL